MQYYKLKLQSTQFNDNQMQVPEIFYCLEQPQLYSTILTILKLIRLPHHYDRLSSILKISKENSN